MASEPRWAGSRLTSFGGKKKEAELEALLGARIADLGTLILSPGQTARNYAMISLRSQPSGAEAGSGGDLSQPASGRQQMSAPTITADSSGSRSYLGVSW